MPLLETHFLVPIREDARYGNGELHPYYRWEKLQKDLFQLFGGWSLNPGYVKGEYPDEKGVPISDLSRNYVVSVQSEMIPKLKRYLSEQVAIEFRQEAIYFFNGQEVEFISRREFGSQMGCESNYLSDSVETRSDRE